MANLSRHLPPEAPESLRLNRTRTGLFLTRDFGEFPPGLHESPSCDDRDVVIFPGKVEGSFVVLHRPMEWVGAAYGCERPSIWIERTADLLSFGKGSRLLLKAEYDWEEKVGAPPRPY